MNTKSLPSNLPQTHKGLTTGSLIRVPGITGKVSIQTLAAYAVEYGQTVQYYEERDRVHNRQTEYAFALQHASCLTADYPGKAQALAAESAAIAAAPLVRHNDVVIIDGYAYTVRFLGNFSDPVKFDRVQA